MSSLVLDGVDDLITETSVDAKFRLSQFTLEGWIKLGEFGSPPSFVGSPQPYPIVSRGTNYTLFVDRLTLTLGVYYTDVGAVTRTLQSLRILDRGVWYHVAAVRDATDTRLYINGVISGWQRAPAPLTSDTAPLQIGTSAGGGRLHGCVRNVRIWSTPLRAAQIRARAGTSASMAVATGAVDELLLSAAQFETNGAVPVIDDSIPGYSAGTLPAEKHNASSGQDFTHVGTTTIEAEDPPWQCDEPGTLTLVSPADLATLTAPTVQLQASVSDDDFNTNVIEFWGRQYKSPADFTLMFLPDTQEQASLGDGGARLLEGYQWIASTAVAQNTKAVIGLGDHVDQNVALQWQYNDTAAQVVEAAGVPIIFNVGNHDNDAIPDNTALYNTYFGEARFSGRPYYLGHYGDDNDCSAIRFQVSSDPVVYCTVISIEYDHLVTRPDQIAWARTIALAYPNDLVVVTCHFLLTTNRPGYTSPQWDLLYETLKDLPQVKLFFCGHFATSHRKDVYQGNTLWTIMADYQFVSDHFVARPVVISARNGTQYHRSYNVTSAAYRVETQSEFTLPFDFPGAPAFAKIGEVTGVAPGATASFNWGGLTAGLHYEWFARARNVAVYRDSARRGFTVS